nr:GGDEF domain-containing protein [Treponema sp.]
LKCGDYMGKYFSPETVEIIYNNFMRTRKIEFTETSYDAGRSYNAIYTVLDSNGNPAVFINSGMPVNFIHDVMRHYLISIVVAAIILCVLVLLFIISWLKNRIINPLNSIEEGARALEEKCHVEKDPEKIGLSIARIESGDELEALTDTLLKMSENVKHFIREAIKSALEVDSLQRDLGKTQEKAEHLKLLATKDALTGIRNKTAYDEEVNTINFDLEKGNKKFGVVMIDLNYLKRINDTYGHEKGNVAIIKLCKMVCEIFDHSPVFRIGGDEFVVILRNSDYENIDSLIKKFNDELALIENTEELPLWEKTSAAIGYAIFDEDIDSGYESVFRRADKAMYERKKAMKAVRE